MSIPTVAAYNKFNNTTLSHKPVTYDFGMEEMTLTQYNVKRIMQIFGTKRRNGSQFGDEKIIQYGWHHADVHTCLRRDMCFYHVPTAPKKEEGRSH